MTGKSDNQRRGNLRPAATRFVSHETAMNHAKFSFKFRPVFFFFSFFLILIAFWCIQQASAGNLHANPVQNLLQVEWLSCSVAVAVAGGTAPAVGCTLLAFGIDWKIDCLDKEPNEFLPFAVAVASCASCHKSSSISESQSHHCLASCPKAVSSRQTAVRSACQDAQYANASSSMAGNQWMHRSLARSLPLTRLSTRRCCLSFGFD